MRLDRGRTVRNKRELCKSAERRRRLPMKGKPPARAIVSLTVRRAARLPDDAGPRGHLRLGPGPTLPCALGRGGLVHEKREGDGGTPAGCSLQILRGWYRPDRFARPRSLVPLAPLPRGLGWCDESGAALYNRAAPLPLNIGHETMWRRDGLYDVVLVLDWNIAPRRAGRGSAIFLHCAKNHEPRQGEAMRPRVRTLRLAPTLGCIALAPADMLRLLPRLGRRARIRVI